jgi:hypothetical protein
MNELTPQTESSQNFIQIDEEGYFMQDGLRIADVEYGASLLKAAHVDAAGRTFTKAGNVEMLIESFDEPFIVRQVTKGKDGKWSAQMPYSYSENFDPNLLTLDEWDRFHGRTERGIPMVFSRAAQAEFFNLVEEYDDESITIGGKNIFLKPWLYAEPQVGREKFWSDLYQNGQARWDLNAPAPALVAILPKLKLSSMRILVLGAGSSNDAAYLAEQGHFVTAVDFSSDAIEKARQKFGHVKNLRFVNGNILHLPASMTGAYDLIFEHTCYCAIDPSRRADLHRVWRKCLADQGYLLGIFFSFEPGGGPPFGGTEWELRARLNKSFRTLYWMRWRQSHATRNGIEYVVFAQKIPGLN